MFRFKTTHLGEIRNSRCFGFGGKSGISKFPKTCGFGPTCVQMFTLRLDRAQNSRFWGDPEFPNFRFGGHVALGPKHVDLYPSAPSRRRAVAQLHRFGPKAWTFWWKSEIPDSCCLSRNTGIPDLFRNKQKVCSFRPDTRRFVPPRRPPGRALEQLHVSGAKLHILWEIRTFRFFVFLRNFRNSGISKNV